MKFNKVIISANPVDDFLAYNRARYGWVRHNAIALSNKGLDVEIILNGSDKEIVYERLELPRNIKVTCFLQGNFKHINRYFEQLSINVDDETFIMTRCPRLASKVSLKTRVLFEYHGEDYQDFIKFKTYYESLNKENCIFSSVSKGLKVELEQALKLSNTHIIGSGSALIGLIPSEDILKNINWKYDFIYVGGLHPERDTALLFELATKAPNAKIAILNSQSEEIQKFDKFDNVTCFSYLKYSEVLALISISKIYLYTRNNDFSNNTDPIKVQDYLYGRNTLGRIIVPEFFMQNIDALNNIPKINVFSGYKSEEFNINILNKATKMLSLSQNNFVNVCLDELDSYPENSKISTNKETVAQWRADIILSLI